MSALAFSRYALAISIAAVLPEGCASQRLADTRPPTGDALSKKSSSAETFDAAITDRSRSSTTGTIRQAVTRRYRCNRRRRNPSDNRLASARKTRY
jgi:hypothetical protein